MGRRWLVVCVLLLLGVVARQGRAQSLHGYQFSTGVDSTKWIELTNPDTVLTNHSAGYWSQDILFGFPFRLLGNEIRSLNVHMTGMVSFNGMKDDLDGISTRHLEYFADRYPTPFLMYGMLTLGMDTSIVVSWQEVGSVGSRILVCEVSQRAAYIWERKWFQIQFEEGTSIVRMVYHSYGSDNPTVYGSIGFTGTSGRYIGVRSDGHYAGANQNGAFYYQSWPGDWRYYEFYPPCAELDNFHLDCIDSNTAKVWWNRFDSDSYYLVRYGCPDSAESSYREFVTLGDTAYLVGLASGVRYRVEVRVVCANGDTSEAYSLAFTSLVSACSVIPFTDLYSPSVECRTGTFYNPSNWVRVVDYGYASISSRHTVHFDTSERDWRTSYGLRTIPPGHCASVRLGNWQSGAEQEDITYTLRVDTNEYDLLILRYAIVEQNPDHAEEYQPHVEFSISDSAGNLIDPCYYANFVSGDMSGWHFHSGLVWRDWSAFGVSLSELHGRLVKVSISNFDCSQGGHFGYTYFTLEGAVSRLRSSSCGNVVANTFHAPQGFNYRWYNGDNPSVTLSTADSLHVDSSGYYYCRASYQLQGRNCGFEMSIRSGTRFPVARFNTTLVDGCMAVRHFTNLSVVATDSAHTNFTNEPCEKYLWRFSDGTADSSKNVTHIFMNGTHTVTLYAMLANGACVDSVSDTFTVNIPVDTVRVMLCYGVPYVFGGRVVSEPGEYHYVSDCVEHILVFGWYAQLPTTYSVDTICSGDTLVFNSMLCTDGGRYSQIFADVHGCDSMVHLELVCLPSYRQEIFDTLPVGEMYPFDDTAFKAPGVYQYRFQNIYGCDSLFIIYLSCTQALDTAVCEADVPITWGGRTYMETGSHRVSYLSQSGTDSTVTYTVYVRDSVKTRITADQDCEEGSYFIVQVEGDYRLEWQSDVGDNSVEEIEADSLYHMHPQQPTRYYLYASYRDEPACTVVDSIDLDPAELVSVVLDFSVTPEEPTSETSYLTLLDQSQNILSREWVVNGVSQIERDAQLTVNIPLSDDTMVLCLVGYRTLCNQTLCKHIPVKRQTIFFPNVFTPGMESNNLFRAIGMGITDFEMWIYDRRGQLVFHTNDFHEGWDGTSGGIRCKQDAYAYTCRYRVRQELGYLRHTGTVVLIR